MDGSIDSRVVGGKVYWKAAAITGLIAGTIFLFSTGGDPWGFSVLLKPMVMGREIVPSSTAAGELNFGYLALHYMLCVGFALIMAPVLNRVTFPKALFVGAGFGALFYLANRLVFSVINLPTRAGETRVVVMNVCLGLVAASLYRGLVRGRLTE